MELDLDALRKRFAQVATQPFMLDQVPPLRASVSDAEWQTRVDLAAAYRLVALEAWDDGLATHLAARVPNEDAFLVNPYGVFFDQINASCLVKVNLTSLQPIQDSPFPINPAALNFHGHLLRARPDVAASIHLHTIAGTAVATHAEGLLPLNQRALYVLPMLAYHSYGGLGTDDNEGPALAHSLADRWLLIMRNHGTLAVGRSIAQAWTYAAMLERVCAYQVASLAGGVALTRLSPQIVAAVPKQARHIELMGAFEWPALLARLAKLDNSYLN